jgi:hypothetical protein
MVKVKNNSKSRLSRATTEWLLTSSLAVFLFGPKLQVNQDASGRDDAAD